MPDQPTFVVNDRRKFTAEGELRHDAPSTPAATPEETPVVSAGPQLVGREPAAAQGKELAELADMPESQAIGELYPQEDEAPENESFTEEPGAQASFDDGLPPGPTAEQSAEAARAYTATVDRLDTAMRATNPGGERMPSMSFDRLVQSLYTQALLLLGGGAEPGETPRVDILGARQTIDMLGVIDEKTRGNRSDDETKLLETALFDLHMGFLEITQALARQAAQRGAGGGVGGPAGPGGAPGFGGAPGAGGPRIVR